MMYMMTEQERAQLLDMTAYSHLGVYTMLKAMQPVSPSIYSITYAGAHVNNFHHVEENAEHEMRRLESNFPEPVSKRKVTALYTPTKD